MKSPIKPVKGKAAKVAIKPAVPSKPVMSMQQAAKNFTASKSAGSVKPVSAAKVPAVMGKSPSAFSGIVAK